MRSSEWVCLMYHDVVERPTGVSGSGDYFAVPHAAFVDQLSVIESLGFKAGSVADAIADPETRVAITFDDGDLGQATRAFPLLAARGFRATFFVTTSWVGRPRYVSWEQLREMKAAGMSIQSHTHTHPFLSELGAAELRGELARSREILDEQLAQRTTMIAWPGGDAPRREFRAIAREVGYEVIATSRWGMNDRRDERGIRHVNRCTVRGEPGLDTFAAVLTGARWIGLKNSARQGVLAFVRSSLGPSRYARWRRALLNTVRERPRPSSQL